MGLEGVGKQGWTAAGIAVDQERIGGGLGINPPAAEGIVPPTNEGLAQFIGSCQTGPTIGANGGGGGGGNGDDDGCSDCIGAGGTGC